MKSRQRVYEYHEGPEAARRFTEGMERILRVSKEELTKREATAQKERGTTRERAARKKR
jgi:hypothetical protein